MRIIFTPASWNACAATSALTIAAGSVCVTGDAARGLDLRLQRVDPLLAGGDGDAGDADLDALEALDLRARHRVRERDLGLVAVVAVALEHVGLEGVRVGLQRALVDEGGRLRRVQQRQDRGEAGRVADARDEGDVVVVDEALDDPDFLGHVVGVILLDQVDLVALDAAGVVDHLEVGPETVEGGALRGHRRAALVARPTDVDRAGLRRDCAPATASIATRIAPSRLSTTRLCI